MAACPLCLSLALRQDIDLGFRPATPEALRRAADPDEEWPVGHSLCGPIDRDPGGDLDRWVAGETPTLDASGWHW